AKLLLEDWYEVIRLDNLNDYYDVRIKEARLTLLRDFERFHFVKLDIADREGVAALFAQRPIEKVVHLAAQAGVRYSLINPHAYVDSNIVGFLNVFAGCHLIKFE